MRKLVLLLCVIFSTIHLINCIPKPDEQHKIPEKNAHDAKHTKPYIENHDKQYDHEAFLGEEEAKTFDMLPPEESKRRLGIIADKIDGDKDGFIDLAELKSWIQYTQLRYIEKDVDRQWKQYNPDGNETIHWETYRKVVYGFLDDIADTELPEEDGFSYKYMQTRDKRRWVAADENKDDQLNKEEFTVFLHPEENPKMKDVILSETIEDLDKDNDGKISIEEYIGDMYRKTEEGEEEPQWIVEERQVFSKFRDRDGDGFLNREEVLDWITPPDFDHAEAEAKHLIYESDKDKDDKLTKDEVLEKYDTFVGSQATDFGEALTRHDEF